MYDTDNDIALKTRVEVCGLLNQRLADAIDLQTQMKQAHWNVKGPNFIGLHELFDDIDEAVEEYVDLIAERIVQLGGIAQGTARVAASRSHLDEYPLDIADGAAHVVCCFQSAFRLWRRRSQSIDETSAFGDADTAIFHRSFARHRQMALVCRGAFQAPNNCRLA